MYKTSCYLYQEQTNAFTNMSTTEQTTKKNFNIRSNFKKNKDKIVSFQANEQFEDGPLRAESGP